MERTTDNNEFLISTIIDDKKTTYNYVVKISTRLSEIFGTIPSNAIIDKGRCGIGGTYLELIAERNSIIVVPTNAIIDNKCFKDGKLIDDRFHAVRGKENSGAKARLRAFMDSDIKKKKIFTTPESLWKIVDCKKDSPSSLFDEWFILFDECHTTISDSFRTKILDAFKYFFEFKNNALISATPYKFSSDKLKTFDRYIVRFDQRIDTVEILNTANVESIIFAVLKHPDYYPGRVHIFLNSVNKIAEAIRTAQITDCSIFCKEDKDNKKKLNELEYHMKDIPSIESFSKFNFYTSKYFEGWDLEDENATIIVVSNVNSLTLRSGISNKCVQAAGRNRMPSNKIIHITNHRNTLQFKSFEDIETELINRAEDVITKFNEHVQNSSENFNIDGEFKRAAEQYAQLEKDNAVKNSFKVDQFVNARFCDQEYNHINYIVAAWESLGYSTQVTSLCAPAIPEYNKRMKSANKVKAAVKYLSLVDSNDFKTFPNFKDLFLLLPVEFDEIRKFYDELGKDVIASLDYDYKATEIEFIHSLNERGMQKVKKDYFDYAEYLPKSNAEITQKLQELYMTHNILNEKSKNRQLKKAFAADLKSIYTKVKPAKPFGYHGFEIVIK